MENIYFMDFETGGLKSWVNGICSFNIQDSKDFYRNIYFYPQKKVYEYSALQVNGLSMEDLYDTGSSRESIIDLFNEISEGKKYLILCGWNVMFDIEFLLNIYKEKSVKLPCPILALDLMEIAKKNIPKKDKRKKDSEGIDDYKLTTVYRYFFEDYDEEKAHTADYDVYMTKQIYDLFISKSWIEKAKDK